MAESDEEVIDVENESEDDSPSEGEIPEEVTSQASSGTDDDDIDRVPDEKLQSLESSVPIRDMLRNPHLRKLLSELDSAPDPAPVLNRLMQYPIFHEFAEECLKHCGVCE